MIVLTYRRPDDLTAALPLLLESVTSWPGAELLVVDNDTTPSAEQAVLGLSEDRVRYVHEPRPGIASARNRGLAETADRDVVIFIDDDERPHPGWLPTLIEFYRRSDAQAVAGPVLSEFDGELDPWIVAGRFFDRQRHATGTSLPVAATNNLLLDRAFVEAQGLVFDEAFGLSGGSDSVFTRQLVKSGGTILWCDEAIVSDVVPAARATRGWVTRRAFRMGNTEARAQIHLASGPAEQLTQRGLAFGRGMARVAAGAAEGVTGLVTRAQSSRAHGKRTFLRGAGMALAAFGYRYFEYRRPSGGTTKKATSA